MHAKMHICVLISGSRRSWLPLVEGLHLKPLRVVVAAHLESILRLLV